MRPRTKRRVVWLAGVVAGAAVLGGALHHVLHSSSSAAATTTTQRQEDGGEQNAGIAYGDTQDMVSAKLGAPTQKKAACWIYDAHNHTVNDMNLGGSIDAVKYCFADGPVGGKAVAAIYERFTPSALARMPKDKRPPGGWVPAITFMPKSQQHLKF
jgi:hypothetical protein